MPQSSLHPSILRQYDVRGIIGETLNAGTANTLGRAFGSEVLQAGGSRIAVGYDGRHSSRELEAALIEGLNSVGVSVVRVGLGPTPMLYYAVHAMGLDGGMMVTGSHNPPDYNGFKLMLGTAPFFGEQIQNLARIAEAGIAQRSGAVTEDIPWLFDYVDRILRNAPDATYSIAWDPGNGSAGEAIKLATDRLSGNHILINADIDGDFPNHHPDPTVPENLVQLQNLVTTKGLDFGFAFDGDGDRIGLVDGEGRILWGDQIMALLARDVLAAMPGAPILADVKSSQILFDEIARLGGEPVMCPTGHSIVKAEMSRLQAPLAGELSGHIFFAHDYYGFDDALYAAVRVIKALQNAGLTMAAFRDSLPEVFNTPEIRIPCAEDRKFPSVDEVKIALTAQGADVTGIDGVRVNTADGWWLLRASNTENVLVARCESRDADGLERLKSALDSQLASIGLSLPTA